jgi:hypothetical protein
MQNADFLPSTSEKGACRMECRAFTGEAIRMEAAEIAAITAFLESLIGAEDKPNDKGQAILANMRDSHAENLISLDLLREFLRDCVHALAEKNPPDDDPLAILAIVEAVSRGRGHSRQARHYLRACKPATPVPNGARLSNTMKTESFHRFLLNEAYKQADTLGMSRVQPPIPVNSPSGLADYQEWLSELAETADWFRPSGNIGLPLPTPWNCWLSTDQFGLDANAPAYGPAQAAEQARDELGLIDYGRGAFLLRLSFSAASLGKISHCETARPGFSDLGNSRFRVRHASAQATSYAKQGWGATVHLKKLAESYTDVAGAPERVTTALPLAMLEEVRLELLGEVASRRGATAADDDQAHLRRLLNGRASEDIKTYLINAISQGAMPNGKHD